MGWKRNDDGWQMWEIRRLPYTPCCVYGAAKVTDVRREIYSTASANLQDQESRLRQQLDDLVSQFHGFPTSHSSVVIAQPNDLSLSSTFAHATSSDRPRLTSSHSSSLKRSPTTASHNQPSSKSVRFSDHSTQHHNNTATAAAGVFPYHDDPEDDNNDTTTELSNTSIHAHHAHVLREQDEQLDRLGVSIGRQRELSIQIGDELEDQVQLLDEVDQHVDRHQNRLDGARKSLGVVARRAKENVLLTVIFILIIVLVLLIIILK